MRHPMTAALALVGLVSALLLGLSGVATAGPATSTLSTGERLVAGEQLSSPAGTFRMIMQGDGNLVVYGPAGATWASRTSTPGTVLVIQDDGNVVAYSPAGSAVWNAGTQGSFGARLVLQDDGNLVVYRGDNSPAWSSWSSLAPRRSSLDGNDQLRQGERLTSPGSAYALVMQGDGNAVVYGPAGAVWSTGTTIPGSRLAMQSDGNLVVYSPASAPVWHTHTGGNPGARAVLQDDGNLVVYRTDGRPPWYLGSPLPASADIGSSTQLVTVISASRAATSAQLTGWELRATGWSVAVGPVAAVVGADGVGAASEATSRTPAGTFPLTEAFGRLANPGSALPYRMLDTQDWWVSDVGSASYNQHIRCAPGSCPFDERAGENLYAQGTVYDLAVVIDYNRAGVRGAGSAYFLHVSNGRPTAGCVATDRSTLTTVLRWLAPTSRPVMAIVFR